MRHIRKTHTLLVVIGSDERIPDEAADVIRQHNKRPRMVRGIDSSRRIGKKQDSGTERVHHPRGEHNLRNIVAFIEMNASFHADDGNGTVTLSEAPENKTSVMSRRRRYRKPGKLPVRNFCFHLDLGGKTAEPRAKR